MALLLDTHTLLWWLLEADYLSGPARKAIEEEGGAVMVSAVSAFDVALKNKLGKLPEANTLVDRFGAMIDQEGFVLLDLSAAHGLLAGGLPLTHKDPFDRLLAAQALVEDLTIVFIDDKLDQFGVRRLW